GPPLQLPQFYVDHINLHHSGHIAMRPYHYHIPILPHSSPAMVDKWSDIWPDKGAKGAKRRKGYWCIRINLNRKGAEDAKGRRQDKSVPQGKAKRAKGVV